MNTLSTLILRFKQPGEREWRVPLNIRIGRWEIPMGLGLIALVLLVTALTNLFTKKVATISGVTFTIFLYLVFVISERVSTARKLAQAKELERFNLEAHTSVSAETIRARPGNIIVAVRNPRSLQHLERILEKTNTKQQDIVVLTMQQMGMIRPALHSPRAADQVVAGVSPSMNPDEQARRMGEAWEAASEPKTGLTFELIDREGKSRYYDLGPHPPRLWPEDIDRVHQLWLRLTRERFGGKLHHRDVVGAAIKRLESALESDEERERILSELARELEHPHERPHMPVIVKEE